MAQNSGRDRDFGGGSRQIRYANTAAEDAEAAEEALAEMKTSWKKQKEKK
jgi:hypothetical protein